MFSLVLRPLTLRRKPDSSARGRNFRVVNTLAVCLPLAGLLVACDGSYKDTVTGELSEGELNLNLPSRIRNISAINPNAVSATATVNSQQYPLTRGNDGKYQTSISVSADSAISVSVSFSETLPGGTVIGLASHPAIQRNTGSNNLTLQFFDNDYETANFDLDGDGCSNIVEREVETNPLVNDAVPANFTRAVGFDLPANIPNPDLTDVIVAIAEITRPVGRNGLRILSSGAVTQCSNTSIIVLLRQKYNGNNLTLATATVPHGTSANIELSTANFNFDEDADGDGRNNVTELQNGTDPFTQD